MVGPAYRIVTPRLVIRCWDPRDAPQLCESITASLDHLRATLLWAKDEPESVERKVQRLRTFRAKFDLGEDMVYGIFDATERTVVGGTGLHPRVFAGGLEIGYWIDARVLRRGYATEVAAAMTRVIFEVELLRRAEIHVDTRNAASQAIPRKLGYTHEATLPARVDHPQGLGDRMIFTLHRKDYVGSPASAVPIEAFGAAGDRLL